MPPTSPARTRFTNRSLNTRGYLPSASAKVEPCSTSDLTPRITSLKPAFACWSPWIERHCTSGRPASIMVANCRVKMTRSRVLGPFFRNFTPSNRSFDFAFTPMGVIICARSWAITAVSLAASITPFLVVP
jgi:hypothetical protein